MNMRRDQQRKPKTNAPISRRLSEHRQIARQCLAELAATPLATALTALVIAIALVFPGLLYLTSTNLAASLGDVSNNNRLTVYLQVGLPEASIQEVGDHLLSVHLIESVELVSPQAGLEEFSANAGLGDLLQALPENPLPASFIVTPVAATLEEIETLSGTLGTLDGVDSVQFDRLWLQRMQALSGLLEGLGTVLLVLVLFGVVTIIGNTVKLAIANRVQEIRVIKLIGGTDAFVARPFLYSGAIIGLFGAFISCLLLTALALLLGGYVNALSRLYGGEFQLAALGPGEALVLLLLGAGTGWLAALLSSYRNIAAIEP